MKNMYCQQCGSLLPEGAGFCPSCGAAQGVATPEPAVKAPYDKESYLPKLHRAEEAIRTAWAHAYESQKASDELKKCIVKRNKCKGNAFLSLVCLVIIGILGVFMLLLLTSMKSVPEASKNGLSLLAVMFGLGMLMCLWSTVSYIRKRKKFEAQIPELERQKARKEEEFTSITQSKDVASGLDLASQLMPAECRNPEYARVFIEFLENGRADTIKEAKSCFDDYLHREKMEQLAREHLNEIYRMYDALSRK